MVFTYERIASQVNKEIIICPADYPYLYAKTEVTQNFLGHEYHWRKVNEMQNVKKMVLFCALGWRSALATKSLVEMGFQNVAHVEGGFDALKKSGLNIVVKEKK